MLSFIFFCRFWIFSYYFIIIIVVVTIIVVVVVIVVAIIVVVVVEKHLWALYNNIIMCESNNRKANNTACHPHNHCSHLFICCATLPPLLFVQYIVTFYSYYNVCTYNTISFVRYLTNKRHVVQQATLISPHYYYFINLHCSRVATSRIQITTKNKIKKIENRKEK